ncbi:NAD-dependent epimerase/dehydratase family protein [Candidatus Igneacidithiobacillus taiwanensis]|uniref:NAD-dependent epimerase/dehydratase family protein n=1 Tax=Candidatus Igneacidithiobacillus taiwanensis TaxID=1945924 RepID=UPI002896D5A3|nr:NAD-dependent epimerase/dehydratase family protein [Candidatus Igneacidithiobacillus taiwanensis]MCE5361198.1 NAD-dependent epimerase/dehydratase family protein [Acidithiobacillus sp.]
MSQVLLTGAAGHTAQALLPLLLRHPAKPEVLAFDLQPGILQHPRLRWICGDLRSVDWQPLLEDVDSIIHLAFVVLSPRLGRQQRWRREMAQVNRAGTLRLLRAAAAAGVERFVYSSSVAAYGAWPDNPIPIRESQPLRPPPGFAYAEDKAAVERLLVQQAGAHPPMRLSWLRLHAIVGPHAQPLVNSIARAPVGLRLANPDLPVQCLHEEDAARALLGAWEQGARGAFNIAAPDPVPWSQIPRRLQLPLRPRHLHQLHRALRPFTRRFGDPGWLLGLEYPLVVDCCRAEIELGWLPRYSVSEAMAAVSGGNSA